MSSCIRSLIDSTWMVRAFDDGAVVCTVDGRRAGRPVLPRPATSLLLVLGPQRQPWRLAVGREDGIVQLLSLPELEPILQWVASDLRISALASLPRLESDRPRIVCGDARGRVRAIGEDLPEGIAHTLFTLDGEVSALRVRSDRIDAWSGWDRQRRRWTGEVIGVSKSTEMIQTPLPV